MIRKKGIRREAKYGTGSYPSYTSYVKRDKSRRPFGFLVVCGWSLAWWISNPFLPTEAARIAASVWGAAVSAVGVILAIHCIRTSKAL